MIDELSRVTLKADIPKLDLHAGDSGTVVMVHQSGKGYTVEFLTKSGETHAVATLSSDQIEEAWSMTKPVLRSFLYLDDDAVDDFLSQLEGGILEGPYSETTNVAGGKEGGVRLGFHGSQAGIEGSRSHSTEISRSVRETPGAKFARLYEQLTRNELIQTLNGFDQKIYDQIQPGEIVELRGEARLTEWDHLMSDIDGFMRMAELLKQIGQDPTQDPTYRQILDVMPELKAATGRDNTLLIVTPIGAPGFKFVITLTESKMRRRKDEYEAEITILGKVQRKLGKGESIDVFRLLPKLAALQKLSRSQRRSKGKSGHPQVTTDSPYDEVIRFPAIELLPIAIYL